MTMSALLAVDDGIIHGELDVADLLFLIAAVLFGTVTFIRLSAKATEGALVSLGLCLVAVAILIL
jgi:hypothetical protein